MMQWWLSLSGAERVFAYIAIPSTLILILQTIMLLIGMGDSDADLDDPDADFDTDVDLDHDGIPDVFEHDGADAGLRVFSVRGVIAFLTVFGWTGLSLLRSATAIAVASVVAALCGAAAMTLMAYVMRLAMRLQSDGTVRPKNAIGVSGVVYLTIPPRRKGHGKVSVLVQERLCELDAVTDEEQPIPTGSEVVIVALSGQSTLVVCRKDRSSYFDKGEL